MKELVDLYAKLLIGTFSFIGPSFTLFIGLFYGQLERLLKEYDTQLKTFLKIAEVEPIKDAIKKIEKAKKTHSPTRQVKRVFIPLLLSIFFICFYYFQHSHFWTLKYEWIRISTISVSVTLFLYSILGLWQIFCIIIEAKKSEEESKKRNETKLRKKTR